MSKMIMSVITVVIALLILTACSSDVKMREKFGDGRRYIFIEKSTGDVYFVKHSVGNLYNISLRKNVTADE